MQLGCCWEQERVRFRCGRWYKSERASAALEFSFQPKLDWISNEPMNSSGRTRSSVCVCRCWFQRTAKLLAANETRTSRLKELARRCVSPPSKKRRTSAVCCSLVALLSSCSCKDEQSKRWRDGERERKGYRCCCIWVGGCHSPCNNGHLFKYWPCPKAWFIGTANAVGSTSTVRSFVWIRFGWANAPFESALTALSRREVDCHLFSDFCSVLFRFHVPSQLRLLDRIFIRLQLI